MLKAIQDILKRIEETQALIRYVWIRCRLHSYLRRPDASREGRKILFEAMKGKSLSEEDRRLMNELIEEHVFGRRTTRPSLKQTPATGTVMRPRCRDCRKTSNPDRNLSDPHREEDKVSFPLPGALHEEEDQAMLARSEFDGK
jgi:hypothetical protein